MVTHSSTLAWKIPWTEEPGGLQSMRVTKSQIRLSNFSFTFHFHALEKEMATHSSVLAWRIPGMGEPGGVPSMGSHRVGHDWSDLAAAAEVVNTPYVLFTKLVIKEDNNTGSDEYYHVYCYCSRHSVSWPDDIQLRYAVSFMNKFSLSPFLSQQ